MVGASQGRFVEVEAAPSPEALAALHTRLAPDEERPVSPGVTAFVEDLAAVLVRGFAFVFDYGFSVGEPAQSTRSYRNQEVLSDVLSEPGSRDISAGVDFAALAARGRERGFHVWGPVTQRDALMSLGFGDWLNGVRRKQLALEASGDWRAAVRLFGERSRAPMLVDPVHLGSLRLIVLGRSVPAPAAVENA